MARRNNWWVVILIACYSCDPSVLLPDPLDPRLPKFTTDGNNVAGAFLNNNNVWISQAKHTFSGTAGLPAFWIFEEQDSAVMRFHGEIQFTKTSVSIVFIFNDFMLRPGELDSWEGQTIEIDGENVMVRVEGIYHDKCELTGQITFFRMDDMSKDNNLQLGMSGTFSLKSVTPCAHPVAFTYGRFDYRELSR